MKTVVFVIVLLAVVGIVAAVNWPKWRLKAQGVLLVDQVTEDVKQDDLRIKTLASNAPGFPRTYQRNFPWGHARWEIETSYNDRSYTGMMHVYQRDGKSIIVWAREIADRLVVPHVVRDVEAFAAEVVKLDRAYMRSAEADSFTDKNGDTWTRVR